MAKRFSIVRILSITLFISLLCSSLQSISVQAANETKVTLTSNVSASLFDAQLAMTEAGQVASFTVMITNNSNSSVNLIDYWARIKGSGGKKYITKLSAEYLKKETVPANSTAYLTFYADVEKTVSLSALSIDILKWDFSVNSYEKTLGNLTASGNGTITAGQTKQALYDQMKIKFNLKNYTMYEDEQYSHVNIELSITNASSTTLNLDKLQYQTVTAAKQVYSAAPGYQELSLKAYETKTVMIGTTIPKENWDKNLILQVLMNDGGESPIALPIANVSIEKMKNTEALTIDKSKVLQINGFPVSIKSEESSVAVQEGKTYITTKVNFENDTTDSIVLSGIQFYVKTSEGLLYPLQIEGESDTTLLPKIKQEITVSGQIPNEDVLKTSQLVYFLKNEESKTKNFLGNFKIVLSNGDSQSTNTGSKEKLYNGLKIEQVSMQRTPNGLNDLIVAEFKVTNTTATAKPVLNITGKFILDSVELMESNTSIQSLDSTLVVAPGQSYRFIAYTNVPYTQIVNKYGFSMSETSGDNKKYVHTFSVDNVYSAKLLAENEAYNIETVGKRGSVKYLNASLYESNTTNLLYAELEYTNEERRSNQVTGLDGYVTNSKGDIVELKFETAEDTILPSDQIILTSWATLPRNFSTEGLEFYFGEAVSINEEGLTAVVNPVYTDNVTTTFDPKENFNNIPIQQYTLNLRDIGVFLKSSDGWVGDTLDLQFEYDLSLVEGAPSYNTEHSILIEFDDLTTPRVKFSKEFKLGEMENSEDAFIVGKGLQKSIQYTHDYVALKQFDVFQMNIYDVYKGHKKLIARRVMDMGSINK